MNFSDDVYDSIINEINEKNIYVNNSSPLIKMAGITPINAYFIIWHKYPALNDEISMGCKHVVYYAMQHYCARWLSKHGGKTHPCQMKLDINELEQILHEMKKCAR